MQSMLLISLMRSTPGFWMSGRGRRRLPRQYRRTSCRDRRAFETWREEMDDQPSHEIRHAAHHENRTVLLTVRVENASDRSLKHDAAHRASKRTDPDH